MCVHVCLAGIAVCVSFLLATIMHAHSTSTFITLSVSLGCNMQMWSLIDPTCMNSLMTSGELVEADNPL